MADLEGIQFGQYELLERIGSGGMAEVYRAHQRNAFGREVAVKVIKSHAAEQPLFYERFLREAQTTARLAHPHILPLIEFGAVGRKRKHFFLVMPYVPDGTLRDLLARNGGPLPIEILAPLFLQLCDAVQYAHDQGLVHRDIKPSNILLQREQHVLLADFGIALGLEDMRLTSTGMGLGTPEYTSPEQAQGNVDQRSDIYSLGVVLFELLTGQVPFTGRTPYEVFYKQTTASTPTLRSVNPNLPETLASRLDAVIQEALAKEPSQRFQTPHALSSAFQAALTEADIAPVQRSSASSSNEPALAGMALIGMGMRPHNEVITRADEDPLGEQPTRLASSPVRFREPAGRPAQARPPLPSRSKAPLIALALVALLVFGGATLALMASLLNGPGANSNSLNVPHTVPTSSTKTQPTPSSQPTRSPQARPTTTPTSTSSPTPSPTNTPDPTPSPTPTDTPPPPTPTPGASSGSTS